MRHVDTSAIAGRHSLPHSHVGIGLRSFRNHFPQLAVRSTQNVTKGHEKDGPQPPPGGASATSARKVDTSFIWFSVKTRKAPAWESLRP